jgi:hypothetical protein
MVSAEFCWTAGTIRILVDELNEIEHMEEELASLVVS